MHSVEIIHLYAYYNAGPTKNWDYNMSYRMQDKTQNLFLLSTKVFSFIF